ncbi:MAG: hypothetical protein ACTSSB_01330 [Candidatus Heimdallarchaeota archaeon]
MTALVMLKGPHFIRKWFVFIPISAVMITNTVIGCLFDNVVFDDELGIGVKTTQAPWVMIFIYVIPMLMIVSAVGIFIKTRSESSDIIVRRRILFFSLGFSFLVIGSLVYALGGLIEQYTGKLDPIGEYAFWILAEIFWVSSSILTLVGFYIKKPLEQEELPTND